MFSSKPIHRASVVAISMAALVGPLWGDVEPEVRARHLREARAVLPEAEEMSGLVVDAAPEGYDPDRARVPLIEIAYEPSSGGTGRTRKLWGRDGRGTKWKVKYGNDEVFTEVAATAILRRMGYAADFVYPVEELICEGCADDDPWKSMDESSVPPVPGRHVRLFGVSMERSFHKVVQGADKIESFDDQGVRLDELDELIAGLWETDPDRAAELDSLKAVAFMLQNSDTKPDNQRLVAVPGPAGSEGESPVVSLVMFQDVGATFGRGRGSVSQVVSKLDFRGWRRRMKDPWIGEDELRLRLPRGLHADGGWKDPLVSREGLRFFLDRAARIDRPSLVAIFEQAEFPEASGVAAEEWATAWEEGLARLRDRVAP